MESYAEFQRRDVQLSSSCTDFFEEDASEIHGTPSSRDISISYFFPAQLERVKYNIRR